MVTLRGKNGKLTLRVADDVNLELVKEEDMVRVDYVEMLSITVDSPAK